MAGPEQLAGAGVPFWREVADPHDRAVGLSMAPERVRMLVRLGPRLAEIVAAYLRERQEKIAARDYELLHRKHDGGVWPEDHARAGMDPASFAIVAVVERIELDGEWRGGFWTGEER